MKKPSDSMEETAALRQKIIGLGEYSFRKSYYPELQQRLILAEDAERRASEALAITDTLLASAPVGFAHLDNELRFVRVNGALAVMDGVSVQDHLGRTLEDIFPQLASALKPLLLQALQSGEAAPPREVGASAMDASNRMRYWLAGCYPIRVRGGALIGVGLVLVDITERKTMEVALREQDRRKDEFLAMLSHELRNPLSAISNAVEVLRRHTPVEKKEPQQALEVAARQIRHLTRLMDDLIDVSRITREMITLRREMVAVNAVIEAARQMVQPSLDARKHTLDITLPEPPQGIYGDRERLAEVFANLLDNAVKYTPPGGSIQLIAAVSDNELVVRVRDNGVGIAPEVLPYVFDLFVQAERSPDRAQGGLGIGLTLVRRIVEMHGGQVEAHSPGIGKGSEFVVRLPGPVALQPKPAETIQPVQPPPQQRRVLLVEDNEDAAEVTSQLLEMAGYEVRVAADGPTALIMAQEFRPNIVLLDIGLPGMDGYEVARRLRREEGFANIPIIALTGYGMEEDQRRAREAGFTHHLTKPVDFEVLERLLASTTTVPV